MSYFECLTIKNIFKAQQKKNYDGWINSIAMNHSMILCMCDFNFI